MVINVFRHQWVSPSSPCLPYLVFGGGDPSSHIQVDYWHNNKITPKDLRLVVAFLLTKPCFFGGSGRGNVRPHSHFAVSPVQAGQPLGHLSPIFGQLCTLA
jgi:hypothetical protein